MDLLRNVEAMLMLGFGALCAAAWSGQAPAAAPGGASVAKASPLPALVVVITAKRLTAAEKRAFDLQKQS